MNDASEQDIQKIVSLCMTKNPIAKSRYGEDHMLVHTIVVDQIVSFNKCSFGHVGVEVHLDPCGRQGSTNQVSLLCICHILRACVPWYAYLYGTV